MVARVVGFYTDSRGRRRPITKGLFRPTKNKFVAEKINIDTPASARESVNWLESQWNKAVTHEQRMKLLRYGNLASNRAKVISENPRISLKERREAREVSQIYRAWVDKHKASG